MKLAQSGERTIVAPCAGAWIEMVLSALDQDALGVAPCAGAWIEIHERRIKV